MSPGEPAERQRAPATAVPVPARAVDPSEIRAIASLLKRSDETIESTVVGTSMGATLRAGTRIRIRCGDAEWPLGAVVVFFTGQTLVGHRVVARGTGTAVDYWVTRGDGTVVCDVPVHRDEILGTVTAWMDDGAWKAVPPHAPAGGWRRLLAGTVLAMLRCALRVDVRLAGRWATGTARLATLPGGVGRARGARPKASG